MSEDKSVLSLSNEIGIAISQSLAIAHALSCAGNLDELPNRTLNHIFWGLSDNLIKIEQLHDQLFEKYKLEVSK